MALIGKIRENSWFLIILLVLGMGGFLFMDMIGGERGSSVLGNRNMIGKVEGEKIMIDRFLQREQNFYGNASTGDALARRDNFWNFYVEETLLNKEAADIGMGVSPTELKDLLTGVNPSPIILQEFGQNIDQVQQFLTNYSTLPPEARSYWFELENRVIKDRLQSKLSGIVGKGLYTPTWMAEEAFSKQATTIDGSYVLIPFTNVEDSEVSVSDEEIKAYINDRKVQFTNEEPTTSVEYVSVDVSPSADDSLNILNRVQKLADEFKAAENDSAFIVEKYGIYDTEYVGQDELSPVIADSVFNLPVGSVIGPYLDPGIGQYAGKSFYRSMKIIDRKSVPDSVHSRHILIRVENPQFNPDAVTTAIAKVDSIKNQIQNDGIPFDTLIVEYNRDPNYSQAGDLGMMGSKGLVAPFRDMIFYEAEKGELNTVVSQFGVHLIEVLDYVNTGKTGARVASVGEIIIPSEETQNQYYQQAFELVRDNRSLETLNNTVLERELQKRSASGLKPNDYNISGLGTGEASRNLVQWSHKASIGDVSPEVYTYEDQVEYYNNKYVIAALTGKNSAGIMPIDDIRDEVAAIIRNEKKGKILAEKLAGVSMEQAAEDYNAQVQEFTSVSFGGRNILSTEPNVVASSMGLSAGSTSTPIVGQSGVYLVKVDAKNEAGEPTDLPSVRRSESQKMAGLLNSFQNPVVNAIKKESKITDHRARYF